MAGHSEFFGEHRFAKSNVPFLTATIDREIRQQTGSAPSSFGFRVAGVEERQLETPGASFAPLSPAPATQLHSLDLTEQSLETLEM